MFLRQELESLGGVVDVGLAVDNSSLHKIKSSFFSADQSVKDMANSLNQYLILEKNRLLC